MAFPDVLRIEKCVFFSLCVQCFYGDGLESSKLLEKKWPYNSLRFRLECYSTRLRLLVVRSSFASPKQIVLKSFSCCVDLMGDVRNSTKKAFRPISSFCLFFLSSEFGRFSLMIKMLKKKKVKAASLLLPFSIQ